MTTPTPGGSGSTSSRPTADMTAHREGPCAAGDPIVDADDPRVYQDLMRRAADGTAPASRTAP